MDRLDGWIEGMAGYEMDLGRSRGGRGVGSWLAAATGGMGQLSSSLGLVIIYSRWILVRATSSLRS